MALISKRGLWQLSDLPELVNSKIAERENIRQATIPFPYSDELPISGHIR
jgi:hypothetical protein